jgi:putative cell wall-binding protein
VKRDGFLKVFSLLLISMMVIGMPCELKAQNEQVDRINGSDRYATAVAICQAGWQSSEYVVLARGDEFADALAGVPLAYSLDAPILLTKPRELPDVTRQEIVSLQAKRVIILGGTGAVSAEIESLLEDEIGLTVERLSGSNRYATAAAIAHRMQAEGKVQGKAVIANGTVFPDALAASAYAAKAGYPILLCQRDEVPMATKQVLAELNLGSVYVIGGTSVVGTEVMGSLPNPQRISGANRYATAVALAENFMPQGKKFFVATGLSFADAISGGVLAAKNDAGLLLLGKDVPEAVRNLLTGIAQGQLTILGGKAAISDKVQGDLQALVSGEIDSESEPIGDGTWTSSPSWEGAITSDFKLGKLGGLQGATHYELYVDNVLIDSRGAINQSVTTLSLFFQEPEILLVKFYDGPNTVTPIATGRCYSDGTMKISR